MPFSLPNSQQAWDTPEFSGVFCDEVKQLPIAQLPLQHALSMGSHVVDRPPQVMVLAHESSQTHLIVRAGVFFNSVLGGCNCADDPTPMDENNEYCELQFRIERHSGETEVELA
jgi:hypothetical protein